MLFFFKTLKPPQVKCFEFFIFFFFWFNWAEGPLKKMSPDNRFVGMLSNRPLVLVELLTKSTFAPTSGDLRELRIALGHIAQSNFRTNPSVCVAWVVGIVVLRTQSYLQYLVLRLKLASPPYQTSFYVPYAAVRAVVDNHWACSGILAPGDLAYFLHLCYVTVN